MIFKQTSRESGEKIFVVARNTSGATYSAGVPVFWETDAISDGVAVSAAIEDTDFCLFAGMTTSAMADDDYGLIQVYGILSDAYVSAASAGCKVGLALLPVDGGDYLTDVTSSTRYDWNFVNLFEAVAASAAYSGVRTWDVFIRAL